MNALRRLRKTKFALLAVVSTVLGAVLLFVSRTGDSSSWWTVLPVNEVGAGLFTTGLFGVIFQYVGAQEAEDESIRRIQQVVADDFASRPDGLVAMVAPETRDKIIQNTLGMQLHDQALAIDVYADLRNQIVKAPERWHDLNVSIALAPWDGGPATGRGAMFIATVRYTYHVVPTNPVLRFTSVSDLAEYREQLQDPTIATLWYFEELAGVPDAASREAFELTQFAVDGKAQPIRRTTKAGAQVFTANIGAAAVAAKREINIAYTYHALVHRSGHLFNLDIARPTKDMRVQFWYGDCGIRHVNVSDYIASSRPARVSQTPSSDPSPSVEIGFDGWIFPKAGVAFVWVLEEELASTSHGNVAK